jgi:predicted RNA-binding protein with EMAP domain
MNDDEKRFLEQIQQQNEEAHAETRRQFAEFAHAIQQRFDAKTDEIEERFQETAQDMRRHFDTVYEATRGEIQLVAESVLHLTTRVESNSAKIDSLAADNEIFKAAFANVDRRLRIVEDIVLPQKTS